MSTGGDAGRGGTILALGILGLVCCPPVGIAAWVMGAGDLQKIERGQIDPEARPMTQVGMVLGIIAVVLWAFGSIGYLTLGL